MTFGGWRRQLRLLAGLERLAQGEPVTTVSLQLGYDSPSAFAASFRRTLGVPPSRYFAAADDARRTATPRPLARAHPGC